VILAHGPGRTSGPLRLGCLAFAAAVPIAMAMDAAPAHAGTPAKDELASVSVIFARGQALWKTDARGKTPAIELVALPGPARDVRSIRSDPAGSVIVVDLAGRWYWARLDGAGGLPALAPLPCGGPVRITADGTTAVCASGSGKVALYRFGADQPVTRDAPAAGAMVVVDRARANSLVWTDADGIWAAPLATPKERRALAASPPLHDFLPSPYGDLAVGVYRDTVTEHGKPVTRDQLFSFALDGTGARRKVIRSGIPLDWSWNGAWVLVQDGDSACIMRAVGGQYKCWKGYTGVSIAPDGAYALMLGARGKDEKADKPDKDDKGRKDKQGAKDDTPPAGAAAEGEGGEDEGETAAVASPPTVPLPGGPRSLYRAKLAGAFTDPPGRVERVVDGAALWLQVPPAVPAPP